jgi:exopolysaccharide biosynthesis polyprenyl glycosylphosphotransferase
MSFLSRIRFWILILGDIVVLYLSLILMLAIRYPNDFYNQFINNHLYPFSIVFIVWLILFYIIGLYDPIKLRNNKEFIKTLISALIINGILSIVIFYLIPSFRITPRANLFGFLIILFILEFIWRRFYNNLFSIQEGFYKIVIIGNSKQEAEVKEAIIKNPQLGFEIKEQIEDLNSQEIERLYQIVLKNNINLIVIPRHLKANKEASSVLYNLLEDGIEIWDIPKLYEEIFQKLPLEEIEETWFLENLQNQKRFYDNLKRGTEAVLAIIIFIVLLPLEILIAILIKLTSKGKIIYKQKRVGELGEIFNLYKFRTMREDAEIDGPKWSQKNDTRVTGIGKILRASHLDELPQLVNIIKGNLSFVGPRPERPEFVAELEKHIPYYNLRHLIKPGLTGWAQINYRYGSSQEDSREKLRYDLYYLKNRSIFLDLLILIKTLKFFFVNNE